MSVKLSNIFDYELGDNKHHFGFDPEGRFQMLFKGDVRTFAVTGGSLAGLAVRVHPEGFCKIDSVDFAWKGNKKNGLITVKAIETGDCDLLLFDPKGKEVDRVTIRVVRFRSLKTRFYNLKDSKGRRGVNPDDPQVATHVLLGRIAQINEIVGLQCGVYLEPSGTGLLRDCSVQADLGNRLNLKNSFKTIFQSTDMDRGADYHVFFSWALEDTTDLGNTFLNFTAILASQKEKDRDRTLSHELVHFLSGSGVIKRNDHDEKLTDLMYKSSPHGIMMRKGRLKKIQHGTDP